MMSSRSPALFAGASLLVGCSLVTSFDDLGGGSDGATPNDASAVDANGGDANVPDTGATDSSPPDSSGNLAQNPSFDDGQGGCGPGWGNGYGMTFTRIAPGRTGPYACEVCIQGSQTSYQIVSLQPIPVAAGRSYYAEGWLATPDGGVANQAGAGIQIFYDIDAGISNCGGIGNVCQGSFGPLPTTWQKSTASFTANGPGTVTIAFHAYDGTPSSCFVVDDAAFYAQ